MPPNSSAHEMKKESLIILVVYIVIVPKCLMTHLIQREPFNNKC